MINFKEDANNSVNSQPVSQDDLNRVVRDDRRERRAEIANLTKNQRDEINVLKKDIESRDKVAKKDKKDFEKTMAKIADDIKKANSGMSESNFEDKRDAVRRHLAKKGTSFLARALHGEGIIKTAIEDLTDKLDAMNTKNSGVTSKNPLMLALAKFRKMDTYLYERNQEYKDRLEGKSVKDAYDDYRDKNQQRLDKSTANDKVESKSANDIASERGVSPSRDSSNKNIVGSVAVNNSQDLATTFKDTFQPESPVQSQMLHSKPQQVVTELTPQQSAALEKEKEDEFAFREEHLYLLNRTNKILIEGFKMKGGGGGGPLDTALDIINLIPNKMLKGAGRFIGKIFKPLGRVFGGVFKGGGNVVANIAAKGANLIPGIAKGAGGLGKMGLGLLKGAGKFLGPIGAAVTAGMAIWDGVSAGMDDDAIRRRKMAEGKDPNEEITTGDRFKQGTAAALSSLTFGLVESDSIMNLGESIGNFFTGKGWNTNKEVRDAGGDPGGSFFDSAIDGLKSVGGFLLDANPAKMLYDTFTGGLKDNALVKTAGKIFDALNPFSSPKAKAEEEALRQKELEAYQLKKKNLEDDLTQLEKQGKLKRDEKGNIISMTADAEKQLTEKYGEGAVVRDAETGKIEVSAGKNPEEEEESGGFLGWAKKGLGWLGDKASQAKDVVVSGAKATFGGVKNAAKVVSGEMSVTDAWRDSAADMAQVVANTAKFVTPDILLPEALVKKQEEMSQAIIDYIRGPQQSVQTDKLAQDSAGGVQVANVVNNNVSNNTTTSAPPSYRVNDGDTMRVAMNGGL